MTFDREGIQRSKEAYRAQLAARPIADKLRLLDAMRERAVTIRRAVASKTMALAEASAKFQGHQPEK